MGDGTREGTMGDYTAEYDARIRAAVHDVFDDLDWRIVKAQYIAESGLDPHAISPAGARGIAQIMPDTWEMVAGRIGLAGSNPFDPSASIAVGTHYLAGLHSEWTAPRPAIDRVCLALASYNAGLGHMLAAQKRAGGASDYRSIIAALPRVTGEHARETSTYVRRILMYWADLITG